MSRVKIIRSNVWDESFERLRNALGEHYTPTNPDIILNFSKNYGDKNSQNVLNKNVEHVIDKIQMNQVFDENDVPHPKTWYHPFYHIPKTGEKCVLKRRKGYGGRGIVFRNFLDIHDSYLHKNRYIQAYIPFDAEFRVITDFTGTIGIREKVGNSMIKNNYNCKFEKYHNFDRFPELTKIAEKTTDILGLDFCGLDIGKWGKKYYVIEANTAPGINKKIAGILADHLISLPSKNDNKKPPRYTRQIRKRVPSH